MGNGLGKVLNPFSDPKTRKPERIFPSTEAEREGGLKLLMSNHNFLIYGTLYRYG